VCDDRPVGSLEDRIELEPAGPDRWRIPAVGAMRVPGVVFASDALLPDVATDRALLQVANVATLPGIVTASYAMPDVHWGYGFPIGGVAATDPSQGGVVSPGGVGFDISCGVRLLVTEIDEATLAPVRARLLDELGRATPKGLGPGGRWSLDRPGLEQVLTGGARYAVDQGHGEPDDPIHCEDGGVVAGVDLAAVSNRALERGLRQVGSLGSGNHFLEVQVVDQVDDPDAAAAFGLEPGRVCVMVHSGSRGLGHQICTDHVETMQGAMARYRISVPDRQLACAPVESPEGRAYLGAMAAAANYGRANRQLLTQGARAAFASVGLGGALRLLYDVSHNLAKLEEHVVDGEPRPLCVHRKGATRALPPGHPDLPDDLAPWGQPVLVPGSMGTASYVLVGSAGNEAFASAGHGAGRTMSRHAARRRVRGGDLREELESAGVAVRARSMRGLAEEAPEAYKDVDEVVATCERAGLAARVARLRPVGVVKG
jgi:tRNA-splicing ligase RtcB